MIKKYFKFFIFACICFIISDYFVKADTVKFNGTTMGSNNYVVMPAGNRTITFEGTAVYGDIADFPQYYLLTLCADNSKISSWSINNSTLSTVNIYDTAYNCTFPNSTYTGGHIVYIYGSYNPSTACNSSLMNCYHNGSLTLYNPSSSSWSLLSYQNSTDNISIDYASNSIISQNNEIINQQQQIINQNNQNTQDIINNQNELLANCKINNYISLSVGSISASSGTWYKEYSIPISYLTTMKKGHYYWGFTTSSIAYSKPIKATLLIFYSDNTPYQEIDITTPDNKKYQVGFDVNSDNISSMLIRFLRPVGSSNDFNRSGTFSDIYIGQQSNPDDLTQYSKTCSSKLDDTNNAINNVNDTLNDDDSSGATGEAGDFFSSFSTDTFGLTSIITAPLNLIQSLTSSSCTALHIPLPYLDNKYIDLPCMTSIYQSAFGSFFTMYQTITFGIIAYWVCVRIFNQVKDFKNPEHDEIEVLDL